MNGADRSERADTAVNGPTPGRGGLQPPPAPDRTGPAGRSARWLDPLIRVMGAVVATALAAVTAGYEAMLTPLSVRWGSGGGPAGPAGGVQVLAALTAGAAQGGGAAQGAGSGWARLPVALVLAVVVNLALVWFAAAVTGRAVAIAPPALAWTAVMLASGSRTTEGDLLLTGNNWVGITTLIAGVLAFAAGAYRLILRQPPGSWPSPPSR